jgi:rapamycin-insensitive companion of mTOR
MSLLVLSTSCFLIISLSLKARPESRSVFTSIPLFYRALHTISTQRYRLPVRRYIFDLFDIHLDADVVRGLSAYGNTVSSQPAATQREKGERPLTMIRTVKRSDGDEDVSNDVKAIAVPFLTDILKDELDIDMGHESNHVNVDDWEIMSVQAKPLQKLIGFDT